MPQLTIRSGVIRVSQSPVVDGPVRSDQPWAVRGRDRETFDRRRLSHAAIHLLRRVRHPGLDRRFGAARSPTDVALILNPLRPEASSPSSRFFIWLIFNYLS